MKTENAALKADSSINIAGKAINEVLDTPFTLKQVASGTLSVATGSTAAIKKLIGL